MSMSAVIDLSDNEVEGQSQSECCSICLETILHAFGDDGSNEIIQCNPHLDLLRSVSDRTTQNYCSKWYHKSCLKEWFAQTSSGDVQSCPHCRGLNTFLWRFDKDSNVRDCMFREDLFQHALETAMVSEDGISQLIDAYDLSCSYMRRVEASALPPWVNASRKNGGFVASAVVGSSLDVIKDLLDYGAPTVPLSAAAVGSLRDLTPRSGLLRCWSNYSRPSLLRLCTERYERYYRLGQRGESEAKDALEIMQYLLDHAGPEFHMYEQSLKPVYPRELTPFLYAIQGGLVQVVSKLSPFFLKQHKKGVLLQWVLLVCDDDVIFEMLALLIKRIAKGPLDVRLEHAVLKCASVPTLQEEHVEPILSYCHEALRAQFVLAVLKTQAKLGSHKMMRHLLFHQSSPLLSTLTSEDSVTLVIESSLFFQGHWSARFDFEAGFHWTYSELEGKQFDLLIQKIVVSPWQRHLEKSSTRNGTVETPAVLLLEKDDYLLEEDSDVRMSAYFETFNALELLLLKLRIAGVKIDATVVHNALYRSLRLMEIAESSGWMAKPGYRDNFMARVIAPLVAFLPTVLHCNIGHQSVLIFCAKAGMFNVNRYVFDRYLPDYKAVNANGQNCLHLALYEEKFTTVKFLLSGRPVQQGLDINAVDKNGRTPLMITFLSKSQPWKVDSNRRTRDREHLTKLKQMKKISLRLIKSEHLKHAQNHVDKDGMSILELAGAQGHKDIVTLLMRLNYRWSTEHSREDANGEVKAKRRKTREKTLVVP